MCINFHEFMFSYEPKYDEKSNNLFKQQFLIPCESSFMQHIVDNSRSIHMNLHDFVRNYEAKSD
jgi:hypothetical protein